MHNKFLHLTQRSTLFFVHSLRSLFHKIRYNRCVNEQGVMFLMSLVRIKVLMVILFSAISACSIPERRVYMSDDERNELSELMSLSMNLITYVIGDFYSVKESASYGVNDLKRVREEVPHWPERRISEIYIHDEVKEKGFSMLTRPLIDEKRGVIVQVNPRTNNFVAEIMCLHRESIEGEVFEYWVVKSWHERKQIKNIVFLATVSKDIKGRRDILRHDVVYFKTVEIGSGQVFRFPENDLSVLYNLKAWLFPAGFENSELKMFSVILDKSRKYQKKYHKSWSPMLYSQVISNLDLEIIIGNSERM